MKAEFFSSLDNQTLYSLEEYIKKEFLITWYTNNFIVANKSPKESNNAVLSKINLFLLEKNLILDLDKNTYTFY